MRELRLFLIALQFLTRVPVPRAVGWSEEAMNASARYFPLVGAVIGIFAAAVLALAAELFPGSVAVGLSLAATLLLTGAFHEDGLADTCDALGGSVSRARALEIMKDSRIGSYGAIGLIVVLGLKWAGLVALASRDLQASLLVIVWAHAASRLAPVLLIAWLPYAGDLAHAKAKPLARSPAPLVVMAAGVWTAGIGFALLPTPTFLATSAALLLTALAASAWLRSRLGGYTGDTLGATQQVAELAVLLTALAHHG